MSESDSDVRDALLGGFGLLVLLVGAFAAGWFVFGRDDPEVVERVKIETCWPAFYPDPANDTVEMRCDDGTYDYLSGGLFRQLVAELNGGEFVTEDCAAQWAAFNEAFRLYDDPTDNDVYDVEPVIAAYEEAQRLCGDGWDALNTNTVERSADISWQVYGIGEEHPS